MFVRSLTFIFIFFIFLSYKISFYFFTSPHNLFTYRINLHVLSFVDDLNTAVIQLSFKLREIVLYFCDLLRPFVPCPNDIQSTWAVIPPNVAIILFVMKNVVDLQCLLFIFILLIWLLYTITTKINYSEMINVQVELLTRQLTLICTFSKSQTEHPHQPQ